MDITPLSSTGTFPVQYPHGLLLYSLTLVFPAGCHWTVNTSVGGPAAILSLHSSHNHMSEHAYYLITDFPHSLPPALLTCKSHESTVYVLFTLPGLQDTAPLCSSTQKVDLSTRCYVCISLNPSPKSKTRLALLIQPRLHRLTEK